MLEYIHAARIQPINGSYLIEHFSVNGKDKNLEKQVGIGMLKSMPIKVLIQISTVNIRCVNQWKQERFNWEVLWWSPQKFRDSNISTITVK